MTKVVSTRIPDETEARLQRLARRLGKTPSETGAMLIEESLRQLEFAYIEFRNSSVGRQAYLKNSNLAIWQVMMLLNEYKGNRILVAEHLQKPLVWVQAAVNYAEAYSDEIEIAKADAMVVDYTAIKRLLPETELVLIPQDVLDGEIDI